MAVNTDTPLATSKELQDHLGLLGLAFAWDADEVSFNRTLTELLAEAMDEARVYATGIDTLYINYATRTARQSRIVARVEKLLAAAAMLSRAIVMKATGTHEPLMMEDAAQIAEIADRLRAEAQSLLASLTATIADVPRSTAFARPAFASSTFSIASGDRTPTERNALADETDDVSAWDVETG